MRKAEASATLITVSATLSCVRSKVVEATSDFKVLTLRLVLLVKLASDFTLTLRLVEALL